MTNPQRKTWEEEWEEFELSLIKVLGAVKSDNVIQDHLSRVQAVKKFIESLIAAEKEKTRKETIELIFKEIKSIIISEIGIPEIVKDEKELYEKIQQKLKEIS